MGNGITWKRRYTESLEMCPPRGGGQEATGLDKDGERHQSGRQGMAGEEGKKRYRSTVGRRRAEDIDIDVGRGGAEGGGSCDPPVWHVHHAPASRGYVGSCRYR
jgi:hypothetical protein